MTGALGVIAPGALTTIQDLGRVGHQRIGIPVGGALDPVSLRAANLLVGNAPDAGGLEMVGHGATLTIEADSARVAFVGGRADIVATRGSPPSSFDIPGNESVLLRRGDRLRAGRIDVSPTLYMAIEGGFQIEPILGSVSTYVRGAIGGWRGRPLEAGDLVPLRRNWVPDRGELRIEGDFAPRSRFRVLDGPQSDHFSDDERFEFFGADYVVGANWNRMGMRLEGAPLTRRRGRDVTSDGVVRGSIQIPGDGLPIVLLAEHQTIGGYPKIGAVISADLPALGRLESGAKIAFDRVSLAEAEAARRELALAIDRLPSRLAPAPRRAAFDLSMRLREANLVSGVVDARG